MIRLVFWVFIGLDVATLLFFFVLGLAAAGSARTSPGLVALYMLVLPAIPLAGSILVFQRSDSPAWRTLAFLLAAAPVLIAVASQTFHDASMRANSNAQGELLFFTDSGQQRAVEAIRRNDAAALGSALPRLSINAAGLNDMTLLVSALRQLRSTPTQHEVLRALLAAGADPNQVTPYERPLEMALQIVTKTGPAPVAMLLAAGAQPNRLNSFGRPLYFSGAGSDVPVETLALLLRHGADIGIVTSTGESILIYAATAGNWKAALFLLQQGANPTLGRSPRGQTFAELVDDFERRQRETEAPPLATSDEDALRSVKNLLREYADR